MLESSSGSGAPGLATATLIATVDRRVVPALDRIADTSQVRAGQLMSRWLNDIAEAVEVIAGAKGGSFNSVEDWFARLIVERCPQATPEALLAVGRIWARAAHMKARDGGVKA